MRRGMCFTIESFIESDMLGGIYLVRFNVVVKSISQTAGKTEKNTSSDIAFSFVWRTTALAAFCWNSITAATKGAKHRQIGFLVSAKLVRRLLIFTMCGHIVNS